MLTKNLISKIKHNNYDINIYDIIIMYWQNFVRYLKKNVSFNLLL